MYKEIDELVESIIQDEIFKNYQVSEKALHSQELLLLLDRYQMVQEEYFKMKEYESYISIDDIKKKWKEMKEELAQHPQIQNYYYHYHQLNDLLDEITKIVFDGVSEDIYIDRWK